MKHPYLFLRRILIVFLVSTFTFVSTFTGEAVAAPAAPAAPPVVDLIDSCSVITTSIDLENQPVFQNPPFAYTNDTDADPRKEVTLDAVQDKLYLDVDRSQKAYYEYNGYLYKTTFYDKNHNRKTIVRDTSQPAQINAVDYNPQSPPDNMVGTYTPPTIVTSPGGFAGSTPPPFPSQAQLNSFDLTLTNDLPVKVQLAGSLPPTKENLENQSQYTNIHYHGFNVSPLLGSDDVLVEVPSNKTPPSDNHGGYYPDDLPPKNIFAPITEYKMTVKIPYVHQSGLFWYHSHAHSLSDNQVRGGLSGGIIIKGMDDYYNLLNPTTGLQVATGKLTLDNEPENFSVNQKVMMFKDFNDVLGTSGKSCFTLNGQINPKITIKPGEVQLWRIANSGSDQYMNIALEQGTKEWDDQNKRYVIKSVDFAQPNDKPNFIILARDGDMVQKPVQTNSVLLPPAARVELLVVGGKAKTSQQSEYYLVSDLTTSLTTADQQFANAGKSYLLATVEVEDDKSKVCYKYKKPSGEELKLESVECSQGSTNLYDYITSQTPVRQDKILPPSDAIMADTLGSCQDKNHHYAYEIVEGWKIMYTPLTPYNGTPGYFGQKRCITQPSNMYRDPLTKKRYFYFSQESGKFFLKGFKDEQEVSNKDDKLKELYDGNRIDKISRVGDLEEWYLVNVTSIAHVFHMHQLDFVVTKVTFPKDQVPEQYNNYNVDKNSCQDKKLPDGSDGQECKLKPQGYRDVINLPKNSITTVRIPFVNPFITGVFVYHCHILAHEDRGMMNNLKVVDPDGFEISGVLPTLTPIDIDNSKNEVETPVK